MGRKFINRKYERKEYDDSEWKHITEISPNVDVNDALDVQDRSIFFNNEQQTPVTNWEKTKKEARNAMDRAGNVGQYIKYVNSHIERQNNTINNLKKNKNIWDEEMKLLRNEPHPSHHTLPNVPIYEKKRMIELRDSLIQERDRKKNHLNKLKEDVWKIEHDIEKKQNEINQLETNIKNSKEDDGEKSQLKDDLLELTKKYDAATIAEIIKSLEK